VLSPETAFHVKGARAGFMKASTSSSHGVRPGHENGGEANRSDDNNCSREHQLHNDLQASRIQ
jgi:hypothetical protein